MDKQMIVCGADPDISECAFAINKAGEFLL